MIETPQMKDVQCVKCIQSSSFTRFERRTNGSFLQRI
jgi:hypothetical protein